jgi:predicted dehydrogenase
MSESEVFRPPGKLNVAVVGLGFMGMTHLNAYRKIESARIVAVCDRTRSPVNGVLHAVQGNGTGGDAVRLAPETKVCHTLDEVLADPAVDVVDLCVPTREHHPQTIAALKAGKHVLCEKPMARCSLLAREIVEETDAARGLFMPAMCARFAPEIVWLKQVVNANTYGRVMAARFQRITPLPDWGNGSYRDGNQSGGALLDLHIHDTDLVQYLFGYPVGVFSSGLSLFSGAVDHVISQYQLADGAVVQAEGSWLVPPDSGFKKAFTVNFEKATVDYFFNGEAETLRLHAEGSEPRVISCNGENAYVAELRHFVESILEGKPPTVVTARDGMRAVEICEAEERSVLTGRVVALPPANASPVSLHLDPVNAL